MNRKKIALLILLFLFFSSLILSFFPSSQNPLRRLEKPDKKAWLGYDEMGRNELIFLAKATLCSISLSLITTLCIVLFALVLSQALSKSNYFFFFSDSLKIVPSIILALFFSSIGGPSSWKVVLALTLSRSPNLARVLYQREIELKKEGYYLSSLGAGLKKSEIYFKHTFLHLLPVIKEEIVVTLSSVILTESSLSYIGAGVKITTPSLGGMLSSARQYSLTHIHLSLFPALVLFLLCFSFSLLLSSTAEFNSTFHRSN